MSAQNCVTTGALLIILGSAGSAAAATAGAAEEAARFEAQVRQLIDDHHRF